MRTRLRWERVSNQRSRSVPGASLSCQHPISAVPAGSCPACDDPADLRDYLSLPDCLDCLPDPRRGAGMRHRAAVVVLAFAVAAMITGARAVLAQKDIDGKTNE